MAIGLILLSVSPVLSGQIINGDDQFDFARSVMNGGDYTRAIVELERFANFFPGAPRVPRACLFIAIFRLGLLRGSIATLFHQDQKRDNEIKKLVIL